MWNPFHIPLELSSWMAGVRGKPVSCADRSRHRGVPGTCWGSVRSELSLGLHYWPRFSPSLFTSLPPDEAAPLREETSSLLLGCDPRQGQGSTWQCVSSQWRLLRAAYTFPLTFGLWHCHEKSISWLAPGLRKGKDSSADPDLQCGAMALA